MICPHKILALLAASILPWNCVAQAQSQVGSFDVLIKGGTVYDGTGGEPRQADIGIIGDRIIAVGNLQNARAGSVVDATNLAVAPGFINMLSHSETSLIVDGRSMSELKQGVTTQIFGESSMGPLTQEMKDRRVAQQGDLKYDIVWTTLSEYLTYLERRGISLAAHGGRLWRHAPRLDHVLHHANPRWVRMEHSGYFGSRSNWRAHKHRESRRAPRHFYFSRRHEAAIHQPPAGSGIFDHRHRLYGHG